MSKDDPDPDGPPVTSKPPPELNFFSFLGEATDAVKLANSNIAALIDATATKKPDTKPQNYVLDTIIRFRAGKTNGVVTVTGTNRTNFKVGNIGDPITGPVNLNGDLNKLKAPFQILATDAGKKKVTNYAAFKLYRPSASILRNSPGLTDQPYYEFSDDKGNFLGLFGASDGKEYQKASTSTTGTTTST